MDISNNCLQNVRDENRQKQEFSVNEEVLRTFIKDSVNDALEGKYEFYLKFSKNFFDVSTLSEFKKGLLQEIKTQSTVTNGSIRRNSMKLDDISNLMLSRKTSNELKNIMTYNTFVFKYNLMPDENDLNKICLPLYTATQFDRFDETLMTQNKSFPEDLVSFRL